MCMHTVYAYTAGYVHTNIKFYESKSYIVFYENIRAVKHISVE